MARVNLLKTLQVENNQLCLVKEKGVNYGDEYNSPKKIANMMREVFLLDKQTEEYLYLLCFSASMKPLGVFEISHGAVNTSLASPREIYQKALFVNASDIVLVHNHPGGSCNPSTADLQVTEKIRQAGKLMSISLIDHIIVSGDDYLSFEDFGYLKKD